MTHDTAAGPYDSEYEDLEIPDDEDCASGVGGDSIKKQTRWRKIVKEGLVVPYRAVHDPPCSFKTSQRSCFIPGRPVFAKILSVERGTVSTHLLNPNLYVIQLHHGPYVWTIKRRYKHFQHLHQQLQLFRLTMIVPMPTRHHKERRSNYKTSMMQMTKSETGKSSRGLPRFPKRPEAMVASDQLEERKRALEQYLQNLLRIRAFRNHHETTQFLDVSHLSFIHGLGDKGKEGMIQKRTGTRRCTFGVCSCLGASCLGIQRCCGDCCGHWQRRWLIGKETYVAYVRPKDGRLHCVMLVDPEFEASTNRSGGISNGIILSNLSRELMINCWTKRKAKEWLDYCRQITTSEAAKGFLGPNRFTSYAPVRRNIEADWFVDGGSYMDAVADVLQSATEEILISDWWLSPEIYMKRPHVEGERWRLDKILQRKAHEGVKIFVLLYKEVNLALGINSFYSKQKLVSQHPENIKVLRHPDHVSAGVFLWAHHEKLVIVDQNFAFVGGIDLCYGRWDEPEHKLTDLGSLSGLRKPPGAYLKTMTSSKPLGGALPSSLLQLAKATSTMSLTPIINKTEAEALQRAIPHGFSSDEENDNAVHTGPSCASDEETGGHVSFAEVVSEAEDIELDGQIETGEDIGANGEVPLKGETPPTQRKLIRRVTRLTREMRHATRDLKEDGRGWVNRHLWKKESKEPEGRSGSDGDEEKDTELTEQEIKDGVRRESKASGKRTDHHVMHVTQPSQVDSITDETEVDIQLQGSAKYWIGKDYTNFIVKDFADLESPFTDLVDRSTTPRMPWHDIAVLVEGAAARDVARHFIQRWNAVKDEKVPLNHSYPYLLPKAYEFKGESSYPSSVTRSKKHRVTCQVVRSLCTWSGGIRMIEESIQQSYIELIEDSKHYIYMENQFFISLAASNAQVQNRIGEALLARILRAHRDKKVFRVFVILPLLPGFEGEVGTNRGIAIHAITHWNYASICRGSDSLIGRLQAAGIEDPSQYVTFHGLRTYSHLHEDPVTELIYVHSKLLIIDDRTMICGSANINDRSLLGKRDSEVCVVIQDETFVDSTMDGNEYQAGSFVQSIRLSLFREHLGISKEDGINLDDPISESVYRNVWLKTATTNTETYDKVFHCVPTDNCVNFAQLQEYQKGHAIAVTDPITATNILKSKVKGHLVLLPLQFLRDENLLPSAGTKEALMPTNLWT